MSNMLLKILILLGSLKTCLSSGIYISNNELSFTDASSSCKARNQTLMVAPTYDEYCMFEEQLGDSQTIPEKFWIGLHKPVGEDEYKWINDKVLNMYWRKEDFGHLTERRCVVARKEDALWKTASCSETLAKVVCVDYAISATRYTLHTQEVNYTKAREYCINIGQDLVVIKDRQQQDALTSFLANTNEDVWIGLRSFGLDDDDYWKFKWIDGEYSNIVDGAFDLLDNVDHYKCIIYNRDGKWAVEDCTHDNYYICTGRFTIKVRDEMTNYYDMIENKKPYIDPLNTIIFNSKSKCAAECSKSINCYMYTYDGLKCELFKKSTIFVDNDVPERKLYLRRLLN